MTQLSLCLRFTSSDSHLSHHAPYVTDTSRMFTGRALVQSTNIDIKNMTQPDNNDNTNSRVVGDLKCQSDSYLRNFETEVVSCEKAPKQAHKSKKHNGHAQDEWLIECSDSVLFPEGSLIHFVSF